jgi:hypothetical protein
MEIHNPAMFQTTNQSRRYMEVYGSIWKYIVNGPAVHGKYVWKYQLLME